MMTSASHLIDLALFCGKPVYLLSLQEDYVRNVRGYDDHKVIALISVENNSFSFKGYKQKRKALYVWNLISLDRRKNIYFKDDKSSGI